MYATTMNHCEAVLENLAGNRTADEQTFASMNILSERLQNLQKRHRCFINVELSPHAQAITEQQMELAIS